jgi:hypothetical protein
MPLGTRDPSQSVAPHWSSVLRPMSVQLKQKRLCQGLRAEHAIFDHAGCCASIKCGDDDHSVLDDVPARYAIAGFFEIDFFNH